MAFTATIKSEINVLLQQVEVDAVSNDDVLVRVEWLFERIDQVGAVPDEQIPEAAMRVHPRNAGSTGGSNRRASSRPAKNTHTHCRCYSLPGVGSYVAYFI